MPENRHHLDVPALTERAARILPILAHGAADRESQRGLPYKQVRRLAEEGLLTLRVPRRHGGPESTVAEVMRFVIDLAAADSNVAQALRPGFGFVEGMRASGTVAEQALWFPRVLAGATFGNAGWEIGGANGEVKARITADGDNFSVTGSKFYSTGALYADWISATAVNDSSEVVSFIVPRDREGLELLDDFDAVGQRLTASGTTRLNNLTVYPDEIRGPRPSGRSPVTAFLQLYLGAVEAGIAHNALTDAVRFARDHARPIKHSSADRSVADPYVQHAVGEISARAYAAAAVVLKAAEALDNAWRHDLRPNLLTAAAIEVAQAQFFATEAALRSAELLFDVGGGSATARSHNLDRHWRNARTVANHNPRAWKASVVGAYRLNGTEPPLNGLF